MVDYRGFTIEPMRPFPPHGYFDNGEHIKIGYHAVKNRCNPMPGATWFRTIERAKEAIDIWIDVNGDAAMFWVHIQAKEGRAA